MSYTFYIEGIEFEDGYDLPCPSCGLSMSAASAFRMETGDCYDCNACMGYGGPEVMPHNPFELNVANFNARRIFDQLNLHCSGQCGVLDPRDVLVAISSKNYDLPEHYTDTLERIAKKAIQYSRSILYC